MSVSVRIPHGLAWATGGQGRLEVEGSTLGEVWDSLAATYPELRWRLSEGPGRPSFWVRVSIDGRPAEHPPRLDTPLPDGSEVAFHILPGSGVAAGATSGKPPAVAACGASRG